MKTVPIKKIRKIVPNLKLNEKIVLNLKVEI
jgi:hypothetical protein